MLRKIATGAALAVAMTVLSTSAGSAATIGTDEGCTPGYWKNHTSSWMENENTSIPTTTTVTAAGFVVDSTSASATLLQALSYKGGSGLAGAERILMRAASAAWLNAAHEDIAYPYRRDRAPYEIVETVNDAIASGDRARMLAVAAELDEANNLGCPL